MQNAVVSDKQRETFVKAILAAEGLFDRYRQSPAPPALEVALAAWDALLDHEVFPLAPDGTRALVLARAGVMHLLRSQTPLGLRPDLEGRADRDEAIAKLRAAYELLEPEARREPRNNLILALGERYERQQDRDDLNELIALLEEELDDPSIDPGAKIPALEDLAHRIWQRWGRGRDVTDLDTAISRLRAGLSALTPDGGPGRRLAILLGAVLIERYDALQTEGRKADLEEGAQLIEQAGAQPDAWDEWNELGIARQHIYCESGSAESLDGAVTAFDHAVTALVGSRHHPLCLRNLGTVRMMRWRRDHADADLDAAIAAFEEAVEVEEALDVYAQHVVGAPLSSLLAGEYATLADGLNERARIKGTVDDRTRANELFERVGADLDATDASAAAFAAMRWGEAELSSEEWERAATAFARAERAHDELYRAQLGWNYRAASLRFAGRVGSGAALALVHASRWREAAAALERARARLLSDALQHGQLDLERLAAVGHGDLVNRYRSAARVIGQAESAIAALRTELAGPRASV